jgi:thiol:disulfide interchange protein/DsbC/DsbD-like thiol-disulfide interchange protein
MNRTKVICWLVALCFAWTAHAAPVKDNHVSAELISEVTAVAPGQTFWVALKLDHDEHWHTYWINDGDSGLPTKITWTLPEGFSAGPIVWPAPQRLPMPPLMSYGYEGSAWLLTEITAPASLTGESVELKARVSWLMCKEVCIPGKASLTVTLRVADQAEIDPNHTAGFAEARRKIPAEATDWKFRAAAKPDVIEIFAKPPAGAAELSAMTVFAVEKDILSASGDQVLSRAGNEYLLTIPRETVDSTLPDAFEVVVVGTPSFARETTRPAIQVSIPFARAAAAPSVASNAEVPRSLIFIVFSAFAGGMILNLMPCVFPVISLKILGFVNQAGENPRAVWHHGLVFAAGVVVSFWLLAGALIAIRASGAGIGWGFQLQSPTALIALSLVFFTLALNLFGVFEFGLSLTSAGGAVTQKQGWSGSFFSGFLATVIATPCTAPFMGVALGYALTQPPVVAFVVFTSLALGMAFPYLLLSRFPALLKALPRPGAWMETMKQIMGFFLLATVVWLFWVLAALVTPNSLTWVVASFLFAAIGAWSLGKWDVLHKSSAVRWRGRIAGLAFLAGGAYLGITHIESAGADQAAHGEWEAFSPERVAELKAEGRPFFIDFTAKWCLTCQVNKLTVLRTDDIMQAFRDKGVTLLVADWTDENEMIAAELAKFGRQSVPVYALYNGVEAEPYLLPELLTKKIVTDALNKLN